MAMKNLKRVQMTVTVLFASVIFAASAQAFWLQAHAKITCDGLIATGDFNEGNKNLMQICISAMWTDITEADHFYHDRVHMDNETIQDGTDRIKDLMFGGNTWQCVKDGKVVHWLLNDKCDDLEDEDYNWTNIAEDGIKTKLDNGEIRSALVDLGRTYHTLQDFYAHSNYIESKCTSSSNDTTNIVEPFSGLVNYNTDGTWPSTHFAHKTGGDNYPAKDPTQYEKPGDDTISNFDAYGDNVDGSGHLNITEADYIDDNHTEYSTGYFPNGENEDWEDPPTYPADKLTHKAMNKDFYVNVTEGFASPHGAEHDCGSGSDSLHCIARATAIEATGDYWDDQVLVNLNATQEGQMKNGQRDLIIIHDKSSGYPTLTFGFPTLTLPSDVEAVIVKVASGKTFAETLLTELRKGKATMPDVYFIHYGNNSTGSTSDIEAELNRFNATLNAIYTTGSSTAIRDLSYLYATGVSSGDIDYIMERIDYYNSPHKDVKDCLGIGTCYTSSFDVSSNDGGTRVTVVTKKDKGGVKLYRCTPLCSLIQTRTGSRHIFTFYDNSTTTGTRRYKAVATGTLNTVQWITVTSQDQYFDHKLITFPASVAGSKHVSGDVPTIGSNNEYISVLVGKDVSDSGLVAQLRNRLGSLICDGDVQSWGGNACAGVNWARVVKACALKSITGNLFSIKKNGRTIMHRTYRPEL